MLEIDGEATRNPIFVLNQVLWRTCEDCEEANKDEAPCSIHSSMCPFMRATTRKFDETAIRVFLTRKEAEDYATSQRHNLGEKDDGWNVWCIPSEGELAKLLNTHRKPL